jgi:molybdopterin/thiamine biosynthesis adenylyltransferase
MSELNLHERLYRGREAIEKLAAAKITVCGAGALGSLLADNLARQGAGRLVVIDFDRVEAHNVGTQLYRREDVGALKVDVLRGHIFRATGAEIETIAKRLDERTAAKMLRGSGLVIDTFDNSASRRIVTGHCREAGLPCLHLGMNAGYGEVRWNDVYRVPDDVVEGNACDYPLARNLILLVVAAGAEAALRWLLAGRQESYTVTLNDLKISPD